MSARLIGARACAAISTFATFATLAAFAAQSISAEESVSKLAPLKIFAAWEAGEIESYVPDPGSTPSGYFRELSNASYVWLLEEARLSDHAKVFLGVGGFYFFILPSDGNQYSIGQRSAFGLTDLHAEFDFWSRDNGDHGLRLKAGVFPFKYNENAKNLGEYMFRTYTYPTVFYTGGLTKVNSAEVQLNGVDLNSKIGGFENDLMVTIKTDQVPSATLSLTEMVSYSLGGILTLGTGVMFDNLYDPSKIADGDYSDLNLYYTLQDGSKKLKSPLNPNDVPYDPAVDVAVDSARLTFKGQKIMARGAVDFGKLISSPMLSEKDLRLYFEGILLGVENRPFYYTKRMDRVAYTLGFNFPTFRILDILAVEWEHCSNPYTNDAGNATLKLSPTPNPTGKAATRDDNKWTVYAQKSFLPGFKISGQVANDHLRLVDYFGHTNDVAVMPIGNNWYWAIQLGYAI